MTRNKPADNNESARYKDQKISISFTVQHPVNICTRFFRMLFLMKKSSVVGFDNSRKRCGNKSSHYSECCRHGQQHNENKNRMDLHGSGSYTGNNKITDDLIQHNIKSCYP